jgi:hypothetical protein
MLNHRLLESLIDGWPSGELGVAITSAGILLRSDIRGKRRARALAWANAVLAIDDGPAQRQSGTFPLDGGSADVEPSSGLYARGQFNTDLI